MHCMVSMALGILLYIQTSLELLKVLYIFSRIPLLPMLGLCYRVSWKALGEVCRAPFRSGIFLLHAVSSQQSALSPTRLAKLLILQCPLQLLPPL